MRNEQDRSSENQPDQIPPIPSPRGSERIRYNAALGAACALGSVLTGSIVEGVVTVLTGQEAFGILSFFPGAVAGFLVPIAFYNREHHRSWKQTWQDWTTW